MSIVRQEGRPTLDRAPRLPTLRGPVDAENGSTAVSVPPEFTHGDGLDTGPRDR
jgi:hypothetical protein